MLLFSTVCHDLALVGNFTKWLLVGSTLHTATAQHPRAPFHKALLVPDKDSTLSVIFINPCGLCGQDQPLQTAPWGCFTQHFPASAQKDSCSEGGCCGGTEGHSQVLLLGLLGHGQDGKGKRTSGPPKLKPWAPELEPVPRDTKQAT